MGMPKGYYRSRLNFCPRHGVKNNIKHKSIIAIFDLGIFHICLYIRVDLCPNPLLMAPETSGTIFLNFLGGGHTIAGCRQSRIFI